MRFASVIAYSASLSSVVQFGEDGFSVHSSDVPLELLELELEQADSAMVKTINPKDRTRQNFFFMIPL